MKLDFRLPRRVRLVYFGRIGLGILRNYITEPSFAIYENPRARLNVWVAFRMLLTGELSELSYYRAFLRWTRPRVVVTMEDNNITFFATKVLIPTCKTLVIQNGLRKSLSHTAVYSFQIELQEAATRGYRADVIATLGGMGNQFFEESFGRCCPRLVKVGNIMNNALQLANVTPVTDAPRVVFISKFPNRGTVGIDDDWYSRTMIYSGKVGFTADQYFKVDLLVARACAVIAAEQSLQFVVLGKRPTWQKGEFDFFRRHLEGLVWQYLPSDNQASSYEAIRPNDIIVNVDSTIGYELFARGLKVGFIAARMKVAGHDDIHEFEFGHPLVPAATGPFWSDEASESEVRRVVSFLTSVSERDWNSETRDLRQLLFTFDERNALLCQELDSIGIPNTGPRLWERRLIPAN